MIPRTKVRTNHTHKRINKVEKCGGQRSTSMIKISDLTITPSLHSTRPSHSPRETPVLEKRYFKMMLIFFFLKNYFSIDYFVIFSFSFCCSKKERKKKKEGKRNF